MYVYIYIYIYIPFSSIYIYIYIYIQREGTINSIYCKGLTACAADPWKKRERRSFSFFHYFRIFVIKEK